MTIKGILKRFPVSFTAWLITFLVAALGLALVILLADKHPQIYYDIQASTSVLDIKEDLPKLDIFYDGIDIRQNSLSLRLISLKIVNDSSKELRIEDYDPRAPLGLKVTSGRILLAELTESSHEYLQTYVSLRKEGENILYFGSVILNPRQYCILKLLVLHPADETPAIAPLGYFAGMDTIRIRETYREQAKESVWSKAFAGTWLVQTLRLLGYLVGGVGALIIIAGLINSFGDRRDEYKRKRNVRRFKKEIQLSLNEKDEQIFSSYIWGGHDELQMMGQILESSESLRRASKDAEEARKERALFILPKAMQKKYPFPSTHYELMLRFIDSLTQSKFIEYHDGEIVVDGHMRETLVAFLDFLKKRGLEDY